MTTCGSPGWPGGRARVGGTPRMSWRPGAGPVPRGPQRPARRVAILLGGSRDGGGHGDHLEEVVPSDLVIQHSAPGTAGGRGSSDPLSFGEILSPWVGVPREGGPHRGRAYPPGRELPAAWRACRCALAARRCGPAARDADNDVRDRSNSARIQRAPSLAYDPGQAPARRRGRYRTAPGSRRTTGSVRWMPTPIQT